MPELPEVETTRRGIEPLVRGRRVVAVRVRDRRLRWPVPASLPARLAGARLNGVERRAKYLLFRFDDGCLLLHLGMSGSLRVVAAGTTPGPWDHLDIEFTGGHCLRLRDPRRFGSVHWTREPAERHALLKDLGVEPLGEAFDGQYLYQRSRRRQVAVKNFIMDAHVVVGVGNIYASEALHAAGIHPGRPAGRIALARYERLAGAIRKTLDDAIDAGGTSLRDFVGGDGQPGYFSRRLRVYQRDGETCRCGKGLIRRLVQGQRATFYCPRCQH